MKFVYICRTKKITRMTRVYFIILMAVVLLTQNIHAQVNQQGQDLSTSNVIQTSVPFLNIAPDSRASAMGDLGVATTPDINSMHWNASKYAFIPDEFGFSLSYTPWLKGIANDIKLLYLTGYTRLNKQSTIAFGLRYFTLGTINFTDKDGNLIKPANPNEFALDGAFSRLFSDKFSGGIAFRYIRSDLASGTVNASNQMATAGNAFATDISMYYHTPVTVEGKKAEWAWGMNISNMGSKISYSAGSEKDFLPANLRLGTSFTMDIDSYNKFTLATDFNKLLVPTPQLIDTSNLSSTDVNVNLSRNSTMGLGEGILSSLHEAPDGWNEKLREVMISVGAEYWYREQFAIRGGYFYEHETKGNRKYFTLGVGIKMTTISLDFSYLVPTAGQSNPLANTMRFTGNIYFGNTTAAKKQSN
jgi:hypothetical protein